MGSRRCIAGASCQLYATLTRLLTDSVHSSHEPINDIINVCDTPAPGPRARLRGLRVLGFWRVPHASARAELCRAWLHAPCDLIVAGLLHGNRHAHTCGSAAGAGDGRCATATARGTRVATGPYSRCGMFVIFRCLIFGVNTHNQRCAYNAAKATRLTSTHRQPSNTIELNAIIIEHHSMFVAFQCRSVDRP